MKNRTIATGLNNIVNIFRVIVVLAMILGPLPAPSPAYAGPSPTAAA
jgi:hypothetical protein